MWQLIFEQVYTSYTPSFLILLCASVCVCARVMSTPKAINSGMICTPYDWLNKLHNLYMQTLVSIVGMTGMKCIIETSLIRVNYICII